MVAAISLMNIPAPNQSVMNPNLFRRLPVDESPKNCQLGSQRNLGSLASNNDVDSNDSVFNAGNDDVGGRILARESGDNRMVP